MDASTLSEALAVSKILGSESRLKILDILVHAQPGEDLCVKEISDAIGLSHSATSHQLARLEDKGLVECCRHGQTMCYTITDAPLAQRIRSIISYFEAA